METDRSNVKVDRELLELAAKAADYVVRRAHFGGGRHGYHRDGDAPWIEWDPLHDDGDALRLAVKLPLSIDHNHIADQQRWVAADRSGCEGVCSPVSVVEDEFEESGRAAATRRAIVRAAAAIGEQMP